VRLPFAEIIETLIVGAGPFKEAGERCGVMLRASDEMGGGAGRLVDRKVDDLKMTGASCSPIRMPPISRDPARLRYLRKRARWSRARLIVIIESRGY
jgi:hypothetical protein